MIVYPSQRSRNEMTSSPPLSRPPSQQASAPKMPKQIDTQAQTLGATVTRLESTNLLDRSLLQPSLRRSRRHQRGGGQ